MGLKERLRNRIEKIVAAHVHPGENVRGFAIATVSRHRWLAWIFPIFAAFTDIPRYVVVTDRRFLVLRPGLMSAHADVLFAAPLEAVSLSSAHFGWRCWLEVARPGVSATRLSFSRMWREEARVIRDTLTR